MSGPNPDGTPTPGSDDERTGLSYLEAFPLEFPEFFVATEGDDKPIMSYPRGRKVIIPMDMEKGNLMDRHYKKGLRAYKNAVVREEIKGWKVDWYGRLSERDNEASTSSWLEKGLFQMAHVAAITWNTKVSLRQEVMKARSQDRTSNNGPTRVSDITFLVFDLKGNKTGTRLVVEFKTYGSIDITMIAGTYSSGRKPRIPPGLEEAVNQLLGYLLDNECADGCLTCGRVIIAVSFPNARYVQEVDEHDNAIGEPRFVLGDKMEFDGISAQNKLEAKKFACTATGMLIPDEDRVFKTDRVPRELPSAATRTESPAPPGRPVTRSVGASTNASAAPSQSASRNNSPERSSAAPTPTDANTKRQGTGGSALNQANAPVPVAHRPKPVAAGTGNNAPGPSTATTEAKGNETAKRLERRNANKEAAEAARAKADAKAEAKGNKKKKVGSK